VSEEALDPEGNPAQGPNRALRRAVRWYLFGSVAALALVSIGVIVVSGLIVREELLRDSQRTAQAVARSIITPLANQALHDGDPEALAALETAMELRSRDGSLLNVKVWQDAGNGQGQILHADEPALIGMTFAMEPDVYQLFGTTGTVSSISNLQRDENAFQRSSGELVEVYTGVVDSAGVPLLFEAYIPTDRLREDSQELVGSLLPLTIGALILLTLATLPLAVSLARRVDRAQQERGRLLRNAVDSSDLERRRIAQDLHDGVIQDLAGVGYSLSSLSRQMPADEEVRGQVDNAARIVRADVASLRTLMADIHPPDLDHRGLAESVRDLLQHSPLDTLDVTYEVDQPLTPSVTSGRLAFRIVRESLRNVVKHADATKVSVRLAQEDNTLTVEVADDGVGFDTERERVDGHLGLRLMQETVADAGGTVTITSEVGTGTRVIGHLPL